MSKVQLNDFQDEAAHQRLLAIAAVRTTPDAIIADIIRKNLRDEMIDITRIVRGESNEVYDVRTRAGRDVILRIGRWDKITFQREVWAMKQAAAVGVPTPTIVAMGEYSSSVYYCIQEKLRGVALDTLLHSHNLPQDRARLIVESAGEILGKLHGIRTTGWGYLAEPTCGEQESLKDRYNKVEAERDRIATAMQTTKVPNLNIETVLAQLQTSLSAFEGHQNLTHGDFGPKHIFVDTQDVITGIIDWEQAGSGDSAAEFARWNFWFDKSSPTAWLKEGYERVASLGDDYDMRFEVAKLEMAVWTLMYFSYDSPVEDCAVRAATAIGEATRFLGDRPRL